MNKKIPQFFCDNCGYEVGHETKSCPFCGRFFTSVRCPSCGYTGEEKMFLNGCPMCGYSAPPSGKPVNIKQPRKKRKRASGTSAEPLPPWTYIIAVLVLIAAIFLFSYFITM